MDQAQVETNAVVESSKSTGFSALSTGKKTGLIILAVALTGIGGYAVYRLAKAVKNHKKQATVVAAEEHDAK